MTTVLSGRERLVGALKRQPIDRPPVWLMRQAGRYLPDYRDVRSKHGFWEVCKNPELSTRVALEPLRLFRLDAAIVFSDILVVPEALGLGVTFGKGEGPQFARPLATRADLRAWNTEGVVDRLRYLPDAARHLAAALDDEAPRLEGRGRLGLLGFAGAPWTLFSYCAEGGGSDDFRKPRVLVHTDRQLALDAMSVLADAVADLCIAEVKAGVDAIQLFDTWGGLLTREEYRAFALPALNRVASRIRAAGAPVILFVRGGMHLLPVFAEAEIDGLSLDWRTSFTEARSQLPNAVLQGNVDPVLLFAPEAEVRRRTRALLDEIGGLNSGRGCIVNLGHGILPGTPPEAVRAMCDEVAFSATK